MKPDRSTFPVRQLIKNQGKEMTKYQNGNNLQYRFHAESTIISLSCIKKIQLKKSENKSFFFFRLGSWPSTSRFVSCLVSTLWRTLNRLLLGPRLVQLAHCGGLPRLMDGLDYGKQIFNSICSFLYETQSRVSVSCVHG